MDRKETGLFKIEEKLCYNAVSEKTEAHPVGGLETFNWKKPYKLFICYAWPYK